MSFTSLPFLSLFLPLGFLFVLGAGRRFANAALLLLSLLFYTLADSRGLPALLASILWNYGAGHLLARGEKRQRAIALGVGIGGNLLLLCAYKYAAFLLLLLGQLLPFLHLPLPAQLSSYQPLGISFFTFQAIAYLIDLQRQTIPAERNFIRFALYLVIYPHLVAGPIIRYGELAGQLARRHLGVDNCAAGLRRFLQGLGKKILLANVFAATSEQIFALPAGQFGVGTAWLGAILYALRIYYDFSGYTDMAIGLGQLFGFRFPENFNYPYAATSVRDFWRRWHMTLSSWFRDYLYIPLGGNRVGAGRVHFNLLLVFLLCGLWHGANWNFLVWGGLHGLCLIAERLGLEKLLGRAPRLLRHAYLLTVVTVAWVFFRIEDLAAALHYLHAMFVPAATLPAYPPSFFLNPELGLALLAGLLLAFPWWRPYLPAAPAASDFPRPGRIAASWPPWLGDSALILILVASLFEIGGGSHSPFIYLRF